MWWLEVIIAILAACAIISIYFAGSEKDTLVGLAGIIVLIAFAALGASDAAIRANQIGCGKIEDKVLGLHKHTPYEVVGGLAQTDGRTYRFVRLIDETGASGVRCVEIKDELPKKFMVSYSDAIIVLDAGAAAK